jgi:branched-chain amino acid transport system permease protein
LVTHSDVVIARNYGYYIMLALLVISLAIMYYVSNSRVGLFLRAMREDEDAASALGVNVVLYKIMIFVLTSMIVGLAGGVFFSNVGAERITPEIIEILQMALVISFAVVGGMESLLGAAAGAFIARYVLEWMRELTIPNVSDLFDAAHNTYLGITITVTDTNIVIAPGAWRFALFGLVMILTLRFARNGLLYPILQWFGGRAAAMRETVSIRETDEIPSEPAETEAEQNL